MFDLSGKVALVTGSGQGNGVGIATALAKQGAAVAVNDLFPERAQSTCGRLVEAGLKAISTPFDVTQLAEVENGIAQIESQLGPVDILVNNAGTLPVRDEDHEKRKGEGGGKQFRNMSPEEWRPFIDLNIYGSLNCIRSVINGMCDRKRGRVIQISSGSGRNGIGYGISIYGASKSGIEGFIRHLSQEVAALGVTANALAVGRMSNAAPTDPKLQEMMYNAIPVHRYGLPEEAGAYAVFLASDEAAFVTGQTVSMNGGRFTN